jgi:hypothetical protein
LIISFYVFVALSCSLLLKAQIGNKLATNFPVYQDTGNPQEDAQRYDIANKAWMAANPGAIPAMVNSQWQAPIKTETESKNATAEQKVAIIPPNQHYTQEGIPIAAPQKMVNNAALQPTQKQTIPNDYPKLIGTGNPDEDHRKFDAAKQAWIAANSAAYAKMFEGQNYQNNPAVVISNTEQKTKLTEPETVNNSPIAEQKAVMIPPYNPNQNAEQQEMPVMPITEHILAPSKETALPNDYPKYVDTGNVEEEKRQVTQEDINGMSPEKLEYIKKHPDVYEIVVEKKQNIQEGQIIQEQTLEKYKVTKNDSNKISPEKLIYMKAHPEVYDMTEYE